MEDKQSTTHVAKSVSETEDANALAALQDLSLNDTTKSEEGAAGGVADSNPQKDPKAKDSREPSAGVREASQHDAAVLGPEVDISFWDGTPEDALNVTGKFYSNVHFRDCALVNVTFDNCILINVTFEDCMFHTTTWSGIFFRNVTVIGGYYNRYRWQNDRAEDITLEGGIDSDCDNKIEVGGSLPMEISDPDWIPHHVYGVKEGYDPAKASNNVDYGAAGVSVNTSSTHVLARPYNYANAKIREWHIVAGLQD